MVGGSYDWLRYVRSLHSTRRLLHNLRRDADVAGGDACGTLLCDITGITITILQLGQVIPQHYEMWADQSTVGVSAFLLLFGSLYTYLAFLDTIITDTIFLQCHDGAYRCFLTLQPFIQMAGSALLTIGLWYWYLKFHRAPAAEAEDFPDADQELADDAARLEGNWLYDGFGETHSGWRFFWVFVALSVVSTGILVVSVVAFGATAGVSQQIAESYGLLSAALNAVMWLPQIYTTYTFGHRGALSKEWVFFSVVMDVVYSVYLALMGLHFSVWANNIPDGVQTAVLLAMIIVYDRRDAEHHAQQLQQHQHAPPSPKLTSPSRSPLLLNSIDHNSNNNDSVA
mmetsp:Transcript_7313/g.15634  ORF Transcript_7313/g.15634 Transcript_7313/m.15634 type:complete len:341 (-) Transcript_7313:945-1967(-)